MTTVLLADDQAVVRAGLRTILELQSDIEIMGEAGDGDEALTLVEQLDPDVVLMDIRMPRTDGIEATRRIVARGLRTRVCMLTTYGMDELVHEALEAGASGFLVKTDPPERIVQAVRAVADGDTVLGPETTRLLVEHFLSEQRGAPAPTAQALGLTDREAQVLALLANGSSNAEIARALFITEGTVKTHVARILAKLHVRDRVQAAVFAHRNGLVSAAGWASPP